MQGADDTDGGLVVIELTMTSSMGPRYSNRMVGFIVVAFERVAPGPVAESDYATQAGAIDLHEPGIVRVMRTTATAWGHANPYHVVKQLRPLRSATVSINGATQTFPPEKPSA
jgi:hypothetical protein